MKKMMKRRKMKMLIEITQEWADRIGTYATTAFGSLSRDNFGKSYPIEMLNNIGSLVTKSFNKDIAVGNRFIGEFESEENFMIFIEKLTNAYMFEIYDNICRIISEDNKLNPHMNIATNYAINHTAESKNNAMAEDSPIDASAEYTITTPKIKSNAQANNTAKDIHEKPDYYMAVYNFIMENQATTYKIIRNKFMSMVYEYNCLY